MTTKDTIIADIETHREFWTLIAKEHGWYKEPFFIQVWLDQNGEIKDSVSYKGMKRDYIFNNY